MICGRYIEAVHFKPLPYRQVTLTLRKGDDRDSLVRAEAVERFTDEDKAVELYNRLRAYPGARVEGVERRQRKVQPPMPYDLAALQKEANGRFALSAGQVLEAASGLYGQGLITLPGTTGRRIPRDVFEGVPALIGALKDYPPLERQAALMPAHGLNTHCLSRRKTPGPHGIITTGNRPGRLTPPQKAVYGLVAERMLEAFAPACISRQTSISISCAGAGFKIERSQIKEAGRTGLFGLQEENTGNNACMYNIHKVVNKNGKEYGRQNQTDEYLPAFEQGELLQTTGCSLARRSPKGESPFTEASLLEAMETAGGSGIGTPEMRAALIGSLVKEGYICRQGRNIIPTRKGLEFYAKVKALRIAGMERAVYWEKKLAKIEKEPQRYDAFIRGMYRQAIQAAGEIGSVCGQQQEMAGTPYICPRCRLGKVIFYREVVKCAYSRCNLTLFREVCTRRLTDRQLAALFKTGRSTLVRGFKDKQGETFDAYIFFDSIANLHFDDVKGKKSRKMKS